MARAWLHPLAAGAVLLAAAAPAPASELQVFDGEQSSVRDDPSLPPRPVSDPPPPAAPGPPAAVAARGPSVKDAVTRALRAGLISRRAHDRYRALYDQARATRARAGGRCRTQLGAVIATLERIARSGRLTASRMPALFLQLRRNTEFWRRAPRVSAGGRVAFRGSQVIFQHYAGQGLQIQPLANWGKVNALIGYRCGGERLSLPDCRRLVRAYLAELIALSSRRGAFTTWEYWLYFGGGVPPWTSGISQGTAVQALSRGSQLLGDRSYLAVARAALGAFETGPPVGVRVPADGGNHYLIYSFAPGLRVLNAFLQAVTGLADYARVSGDVRGQSLFQAGDRAARRAVPRYDTGSWSLYSNYGNESSREYHLLVTGFLRNLCARTGASVYCRTAERFDAYTRRRYGPQRPPRPAPPRPPARPSGPTCGTV